MKTFPVLEVIAIILFLSSTIVLNAQTEKIFFTPEIKYEKAILSGKITGMIPGDSIFTPLNLSFTNVVTADRVSYDIPVKKDGTFILSIPVQCITFPYVQSIYCNNIVCLIPGEETRLEIVYESEHKHIKLINSLGLTGEDAINMMEVTNSAVTNTENTSETTKPELMTPEIYSQRLKNRLTKCLDLLENTDKLSDVAKQVAKTEMKAYFIFAFMFDYDKWLGFQYMSYYKKDSVPKDFQPQKPGKSYYSFLKARKLYDPVNFSAGFYSNVLQLILSNDTLAIPDIGDMSVDTWLKEAKEILKDDIGTDTGPFYDLLAGNAYAKQFNEMKPLSEIQKKNIESYFKNKSFVNILFDENENVLKIAAKSKKVNICQVDKSIGNVMDTIISRYKEKIIFVDFWTTWCAPCIRAIKESESVKKEFENRDVVFVYITNPTSPSKTWENKILEWNGEHYCITVDQWHQLEKIYDINGLPHYLMFNKTGILKYNQGGFMGNENMRKWIKESL